MSFLQDICNYVRAKMGIVSSTTEALRKFYEKNSYALLKDENTLTELTVLAEFWEDISNQDTDRFSNRVLKQVLRIELCSKLECGPILYLYILCRIEMKMICLMMRNSSHF